MNQPTRTDAPPIRVYVVVSAPAGSDPEETTRAIAHAARKAAPGADVYHCTPGNPADDRTSHRVPGTPFPGPHGRPTVTP